MVECCVHRLLTVFIIWHTSRAQTDANLTDVKVASSHKNFTNLLNTVLEGYEPSVRPGDASTLHGSPTKVMVDMNIRSMGPISEVDMTYSMDTYFRQTWVDKRLVFDGPRPMIAVQIKLLEHIWKPDTFFYNGRDSYLHTITSPNKLLRIMKNGTVWYSMRLTIKASCPMYLHYFPMDQQLCPLQFGSYAYTKEQLYYEWKHGPKNSIKTSPDMRLSQFDLINHPAWNLTVSRSGGAYSTLKVNFRLQRHAGYFLIQVYVPCTLIVILSWVSFWINREATADRFTLGITAVLTLTTLSMANRDDLPRVSYATALDWFVFMCYGFVVGSILEFVGVHYFTKIGSGEPVRFRESDDDDDDDEDDDDYETKLYAGYLGVANNIGANHKPYPTANGRLHNHQHNHQPKSYLVRRHKHKPAKVPDPRQDGCFTKFVNCLQGNTYYRTVMRRHSAHSSVNSVSLIDKVSRILFPLSFIFLNVIYWIAIIIVDRNY